MEGLLLPAGESFTGWSKAPGQVRIGFGECRGEVWPAVAWG